MIRTFIYGSCVSRDTFEYLRPHGYELVEYVARQSLLSAYSALDPADLPEVKTSSPFQHRMIKGDWTSSLLPRLSYRRGETDLLLWDLCDERLGVWRLASGHLLTRSVDALAAGLEQALPAGSELVRIGDPWHRQLFAERVRSFGDVLTELGLKGRTLVLAPPWATQRDDGVPAPSSYGFRPEEANPVFDGYYDIIDSILKVPVLRLAGGEVSASANHPWGPAPFHYTEAVYRSLVSAIMQTTGQE